MNWGSLTVEKIGYIVIVSAKMGWNVEVAPWSNKICGYIPETLRPKSTQQVPGVHDGGSCIMSVESGGTVRMVTRGTAFVSGGTFFGQAVYSLHN